MSLLHTQSNVSETKVRSLGPFLMKPTQSSMGFWVCFPDSPDNIKVEVEIFSATQTFPKVAFTRLEGSIYGIWLAESSDILNSDSLYSYRLILNDKKFESELKDEDFKFRTLADDKKKNFEFALISCNGIEEFEKHNTKGNAWAMWERLLTEADSNSDLRLLILGGDQVYMDKTFEPIKKEFKGKSKDVIREKILKTYFKYWGDPSYSKLMASLPSLLMWDDHDLIDGFGSRPEQYEDGSGNEYVSWNDFRKTLTRAFYEFQACRNPGEVSATGPFSFSKRIGKLGFSVLDLRSERNAIIKRLLKKPHKKQIEEEIFRMIDDGASSIHLVSPVTLARMGGPIESTIGKTSNYLWRLSQNLSFGFESEKIRTYVLLFFALLSITLVNTKLLGSYGYVPAIATFLFSFFNIIWDFQQKISNFSKKATWTFRLANASYALIVLGYFWIRMDISIFFKIETLYEFRDNLLKALWYNWVLLSCIIASTLILLHSKKTTKNLFKYVGAALAVISFLIFFWKGLPVRNPSFSSLAKLFPIFYLQILGIGFYLMALLEANGVIDTISGLDDDLKDAWSSDTNQDELIWLSSLIRKIQSRGARVFFLTGDIHTGGISRITTSGNFSNEINIVSQVVSSPIGYVPMANLVEKFTSESSVSEMKAAGLKSYNLFYKCQRNFVILSAIGSQIEARFYFEDIDIGRAHV